MKVVSYMIEFPLTGRVVAVNGEFERDAQDNIIVTGPTLEAASTQIVESLAEALLRTGMLRGSGPYTVEQPSKETLQDTSKQSIIFPSGTQTDWLDRNGKRFEVLPVGTIVRVSTVPKPVEGT